MRLEVFSLAVLVLFLCPSVLGLFSFLSFPPQPPAIFLSSDINGEDINVNKFWAAEAWIDILHTDVNIADFNVAGDVNASGSIEAGVCVFSDCFSSVNDRDNWIDASGPTWGFNNFGIDVDGDIDGFDIFAGNDLGSTNDLDVGDDADIHGSVVVDEDVNVGQAFGVLGDSYFGGGVVVEGDSNFTNTQADYFFGDGSGLTGITASSGWPADTTIDTNTTAYASIQADLNTFYNLLLDSNNASRLSYTVLADLNGSFYGKQDINNQFVPYIAAITDLNMNTQGIKAFGDSNFNNLQANFFFGDGSGLTGIIATSGWPADTTIDSNASAYASIQIDLNTFYNLFLDSNNPSRLLYSVIADPPWAIGTIRPDTTIDSNTAAYASIQADLNTFYNLFLDSNNPSRLLYSVISDPPTIRPDTTIDSNTAAYASIQIDLNTFYNLFLDSNNASRLTYTVIADPPWATGTIRPDTTIDTNTTAYASIQADLNTFYNLLLDSNNASRLSYTVLADLNGSFYGKQDINNQFVPYIAAITDLNMNTQGIKAFGDSNFNNLQANFFFGDGSGLTGITATADVNGEDVTLNNVIIDGNLGVTGDVNFGGSLSVEGVTFTNEGITVDGNVTAESFNAIDENFAYQIDGTTILKTGTAGNENIFVGAGAFSETEGTKNLGIGFQAGYLNNATGGSAGTENMYIGFQAGYGQPALKNSGYSNIGIGYKALANNWSGHDNLAIGKNAMYGGIRVTGRNSIALGKDALWGGGDYFNVAIGEDAMRNAGSGAYSNVGIGGFSAFSVTSGNSNMAIGYSSMFRNSTGSRNVAIGVSSDGLTAGAASHSDTIAIGNQSGRSNGGSENIFIGSSSGYSNTTGDSLVFIGYKAGYNQTTADDLLIIDNQDRGSDTNEAAKSLIYGIFASDPADQIVRINADLNVDGNIFGATIRGFAYDYNEMNFPAYSFDDANVGILINLLSTYINGLGYEDSNFTVIKAGWYKISGGASFSTATANQEVGLYAAKNNIAIDEGCHVHRKTGSGGDIGNMNWTPCAVELAVGDKITLQVENEATPVSAVSIHDARIEIEWIAN